MEERKSKKREEKDEEEDFYDCHETLESTQEPEIFKDTRTKKERLFYEQTNEGIMEETREEPGEEHKEGCKETEKELTDKLITEKLKLETKVQTETENRGDRVGAKGDEERREGCKEEEDKMVDLKETDTDSVMDRDVEYEECAEGGAVLLRPEEVKVSEEREELQEEEEVQVDEEYQRELEKDLSDEEKEMRREQSLSLKDKGNQFFKNQQWSEACSLYSEALGLCPLSFSKDRAVLFSNRAAARVHLDQKDKAIADCSKAVELNPDYLRALLRRAELYEQTEKLDEALEDFNKVLEKDPQNTTARQASMRLPQQIHERNERLKEEMMGKLKELGNMILRPFGLSTSNFQLNQDQATGAYNINFVQNPNNNNNR